MNIGALYDSLPEDKRDMTRENFIREVKRLTDPRRMQSDLNQILEGKRQKLVIDGAVQNG